MIIVSAIFVLIAQNSVVELSLGPVKVNKPSLALTALPVLLSYLWFRWVGHEVDYGAHLNAYNCMIRSKMPDFDDVSEFLLPVASISGRSMRSQRRPLGSPAEAAAFYLAAIIEITVLYWLPLLGTIAMYVFLYVSEGSSPLLIISTIISGFVTAAALAQRKW